MRKVNFTFAEIPPLSTYIKGQRETANLSQDQFAVLLGRTQPWVSQLETGKVYDIDGFDIIRVSLILDVPVKDIMDQVQKTWDAAQAGALMVPEEGSGQKMVIGRNGPAVVPDAENVDPLVIFPSVTAVRAVQGTPVDFPLEADPEEPNDGSDDVLSSRWSSTR
jgi:predicted XRE-type DNA-binding protein